MELNCNNYLRDEDVEIRNIQRKTPQISILLLLYVS